MNSSISASVLWFEASAMTHRSYLQLTSGANGLISGRITGTGCQAFFSDPRFKGCPCWRIIHGLAWRTAFTNHKSKGALLCPAKVKDGKTWLLSSIFENGKELSELTAMEQIFAKEFIHEAIMRLEENTPKIKKSMDLLTEEEIWQRPNRSSNSIGNLVLHLCGNITQYILSGLGEVKDTRERDKEFSTQGGLDKKELLDKLMSTVSEAVPVIGNTNIEGMLKKRSVQGFELSAIGIIIHVVEHYSYHTGQIIFWTKLLKDKDLAFYGNVDLNKKNVT